MIEDINVNQKLSILTRQASGFASGFNLVEGAPNVITPSNDTDISLLRLDTAGLVGWRYANAITDIARDILYGVHDSIDWTKDTFWRVLWSDGAAVGGTNNVTWKFLLVMKAFDAAPTAGATALTTPLVNDAGAGANVVQGTLWGTLAKNTLPTQNVNTYLVVDINAPVVGAGATSPTLLGYQIAYTPRLTGGKASDRTLAAPTDA